MNQKRPGTVRRTGLDWTNWAVAFNLGCRGDLEPEEGDWLRKRKERERGSKADVWSCKADSGAVMYSLTKYKLKLISKIIVN